MLVFVALVLNIASIVQSKKRKGRNNSPVSIYLINRDIVIARFLRFRVSPEAANPFGVQVV